MGLKLSAQGASTQVINTVSVPLRGNGFETASAKTWVILMGKFPSPCGVMGLKQHFQQTFTDYNGLVFPSPCGVMGLKPSKTCVVGLSQLFQRFPSPCGVMGLKLIGCCLVVLLCFCFRPLAG